MTQDEATGRSRPSARAREAAATWESLFRAQVALVRRFQRDDWGGLSMREYDVLFTLSLAPGNAARLRDLLEGTLLSQPSLSRLVERLEVDGLVRRERAPEDGRGVVVTLTPRGAQVQREVGRRHVARIDELVGGALTPEELVRLRELTDKLREAQTRLA